MRFTRSQRRTKGGIGKSKAVVGEGNGTPLQYSCLDNPMDGGAWWAAVHGVAKSQTRLRDFTFTFHFPALEKAMATHSSVPPWRIPETGEPGVLLSLGSQRVGCDFATEQPPQIIITNTSMYHKSSTLLKLLPRAFLIFHIMF